VPEKIIIISNGRFGDARFLRQKMSEWEDLLIICCDGAAYNMDMAKIMPDIIIGDMDSLKPLQLKYYRAQGINIIEYPSQKDLTDTELALDYAINLKPEEIYIWGALGGRIDHILGNVFLLIKGKKAGINTFLIDEYGEAFMPQGEVVFQDAAGSTVSLLALSAKVEDITMSGFFYPLYKETLHRGETRGLSNYINDITAKITFSAGELLVIRYWQEDMFPEAA